MVLPGKCLNSALKLVRTVQLTVYDNFCVLFDKKITSVVDTVLLNSLRLWIRSHTNSQNSILINA